MDVPWKYFVYILIVSHINLSIFYVDVYGIFASESEHCISRNSEITCNYIPADIPDGTMSVNLRNISDRKLRKGLFSTYKWGQIKNLEISASTDWLVEHDTVRIFDSFCFFGLKSLEMLRIGIAENITLASDSLIGLKNLKHLDLTGCRRLYLEEVLNAIDDNNDVANLQSLNLALLNSYRAERSCPNLKSIDTSYVVFPSKVMPINGQSKIVEQNANVAMNFNWIRSIRFLQNIRSLNLTSVLPKWITYSIDNVTMNVFGANRFKLEVLRIGNNSFERIDLKLNIPGCPFVKLDFSGCNVRYLHPKAISSFRLLSDIDLSRNKLSSMMVEDYNLFENIFKNLTNLQSIRLSFNELTGLPKYIFAYNLKLELIDLSDNLITKLSFEVKHLKLLRILDVRKNRLQVIDTATFNTFDNVKFLLQGNPIQCSKCWSLAFINWLKNSAYNSDIKCENKDSKEVFINDNTIGELQEICNRAKIIIVVCSASVLALVLVVAIILKMRRYKQQRQYQLEMEDRIALIREGADDNKFVVFLSYSSNDDDFVNRYIFNQINENLKQKVGKDHNLVCIGDKHFEIGKPIPEQISRFLHKSSVVVILLTDHYSQSVHCRNEFDQATLLEKPIVLMVKDEINRELMNHQMRDLYEHRTRILFAQENGEYVLKTSWENVCTSIIELVNIG
ncbi:toll-like receptor 2 type-1 [Ruditapes philippinarum]|uniref:toll-like receptor 2 type-1 n=1 Tax=Ruditapes philippinarum TaxID=129788 RepID=UPI00295AC80C|nr:toll-like receptor 2 type-1 [Ruditapes philippinarum]